MQKVCPGGLGFPGPGAGEGDPVEGWGMLPGQGAHQWGSARLLLSCHHRPPSGREAKLG